MALDSSASYEKIPPSAWTREMRLIEGVRQAQKHGNLNLSAADMADLLNILGAVDDYAKGTATTMNTIQTNYNAAIAQKKK
jgi:hypothetical protein